MAQQADYAIEDVTTDLARVRIGFVNVYLAGLPPPSGGTPALRHRPAGVPTWALVDAGLTVGAAWILDIAAQRFGEEARPAAIILTHGHFDHVGGLEALLAVWDVPVYAHTAELPYLTGRRDYPPPDATVGGGLISRLSPIFPQRGMDLGDRVRELPSNGDVPGMPGWRWIHTPGHSPGHVSLFRARDRMLIAGDALATTRQESVFSVVTQPEELTGPPACFTIDWDKAERSAAMLAALKPEVLVAGHGEPIRDAGLPGSLAALARDFARVRPAHGRYVNAPAWTEEEDAEASAPVRNRRGVRWGTLSGVAAATVAGTWLYRRFGKRASQ